MTTRELLDLADNQPLILIALNIAPLIASWLVGVVHGKGKGSAAPWKYIYSVLVYAVCIPGMASSILTAYTMFFQRANLLDVDPLIYFAPIVTMVVSLVLIRRNVSFADVPGFDRLSGLMVMLGCSLAVALAIDKTRIFVGFFGSIERLFALAVGVFALIKWGAYMLFRNGDQPKRDMPDLSKVDGPDLRMK